MNNLTLPIDAELVKWLGMSKMGLPRWGILDVCILIVIINVVNVNGS